METHTILPGTASWRQVYNLYKSAFPAAEQRPFFRMWLLSRLRKNVVLQGWFEGETLCGFALYVLSSCLYIAYIAVSEDQRSRGLGTSILRALHAQHPELSMLVEIEDPQIDAENSAQRLRRAAFYERNGFHALERTITGGGVSYRLYSTGQDYDRDAYFAMLSQLSFRRR